MLARRVNGDGDDVVRAFGDGAAGGGGGGAAPCLILLLNDLRAKRRRRADVVDDALPECAV